MTAIKPTPQEEVYTVSQLTSEARIIIEEAFAQIWIIGEISNLSKPTSGHMYFCLKDQSAQIRCALFRMNRRNINFTPENGQQVLLLAQVSLYEARGDFQLIVTHMELAGDGALQIAFEKLKQKLAHEGLFDEEHKKPLPELPQKIGIITSPTGAAIHDVLTVLKKRFASIPVIIYPTMVQGNQAKEQIVKAIQVANRRKECDVLILTRGGGSLEDLWPFNEEKVARAIFASKIPIVTGIGHEVDFTIADFVADLRAATPSAAAAWVSPDRSEYAQNLKHLYKQLYKLISTKLHHSILQIEHLQKRLRHPGQKLYDQIQHLDQLEQKLLLAQKNLLEKKQAKLDHLIAVFSGMSPRAKIINLLMLVSNLKRRNTVAISQILEKKDNTLKHLRNNLHVVSPLQTLERGYSILTHEKTGKIIRSNQEVKQGEKIRARLARGEIACVVEET